MQFPGAPSLIFLGYLLAYVPWMAIRTRKRLAAMGAGGTGPRLSRAAVWTSTCVSLTLLLVLSWMVGRGFGYEFLALPAFGLRELLATVGALAACFVMRQILRALRTEEERRRAMVYVIAPRTPQERALFLLAVLLAGVAEEIAYRGVGMNILWYALGEPWLPVLILSVAFAVAHAAQGWKSGLMIFGMALVMHGLVQFTGSLLPAMAVHIAFDLVAGLRISRDAARLDQEAARA